MEDLKLEDDEAAPTSFGVGPLLGFLADRELGFFGRNSRPKKKTNVPVIESDEIAEERLITKEPMGMLPCKLMGNHTRSTFLMVFSPDKELLASTHGDHNIYISEVKTGECLQVLTGHPRTPWCVAFHPSHNGLLASGCLGGHVRVWDLNGGSELWTTDSVIASLAFHPVERLLVVATLNELHFWDWSLPEPFCKVSTKSEKEKVRYVKFDSLGHHLITGIANLTSNNNYHCPGSRMTANQSRAIIARAGGRRPGNVVYGRYYRGGVDPIINPQAQQNSNPPSTVSSASQTLSDLAAAASDQLMAENAAAAAAAAITAAADAAEAAAEAAAVLPRMRRLADDPLLSDHSYGVSARRLPSFSRSSDRPRYAQQLMEWESDIWRPWRPPSSRDSTLDHHTPQRANLEEIYQRERRVQQLLMRFRHSPESSFVEFNPVRQSSETEMYANPDRPPPGEANDRYREIRDRRLQRQMVRRQYLLDRILYRRSGASSSSTAATPNTSRPIDDWAINRRMALQQLQAPVDPRGYPRAFPETPSRISAAASAATSNDDNDDADSITAQFGDFAEERPNLRGPIEPEVTSRPLSTVEANILAAESPDTHEPIMTTPVSSNDHNYTLSPGGTSTASSATASPNNSQNSATSTNLDIALLNRHIDHMQRICRDSLADCTASRRRRQMVRLQSIKKILEDLQRQIRSLRAASHEELSRTSSRPSAAPSSSTTSSSQTPPANATNMDSDEDDLEATAQLGLEDRNYDERVGEGHHMRSLARSTLTRALSRLEPQVLPQPSNSDLGLRRTTNRLSRVHNQLVSQMRATFRAMEMSPDLAQRGKSPLADAKASASQKVMERTQKTATVVLKSPAKSNDNVAASSSSVTKRDNTPVAKYSAANTCTKLELRALSQRLERMLREKREANPNWATCEPSHDLDDFNIPRPDALPLDPRKRWRHMYDGTLPPRPPSSSSPNNNAGDGLDSSESESESDLELRSSLSGRSWMSSRSLRDIPSPRRLRWRPPSVEQRRRNCHIYSNYARLRSSGGRSASSSIRSSYSQPRPSVPPEALSSSAVSNEMPLVDGEDASEDLGSERLPPLRELIWRRLRRRNAAELSRREAALDSINASGSGGQLNTRHHREALSWMVDQMRLDHANGGVTGPEAAAAAAAVSNSPSMPPTGGSGPMPARGIPSVPIPQGLGYWQGMSDPFVDHAAFRSRYVNRIRTEESPRISFSLRASDHYLSMSPGVHGSNMLLTHRIQAWDFSKGEIPDLAESDANLVVREAKIHNDASVDISEDGLLLVTLVPSNLPMTTVVGVYSLDVASKGRLFASYSLESSAVSVSLSPTSKHLMVGLAMRAARITLSPSDRSLMAQIFRIKMPWENTDQILAQEQAQQPQRGRLIHRRDLHQNEPGQTSLNCIRWIPVAGLGLVYATNTGLLKILR